MKRVAISTLNASTVNILNVIRQNATAEYQQLVPRIDTAEDIPKVGEVLYGYPAMANQFLNALINRIALVRVKSATFNNAWALFKKGYLEYGETIEEVFVNIAKAKAYSAEKGEEREFKRNIPDVRAAFHIMNWRVLYPVTIQDTDLKLAFLSADGVQDLIAKIVDSIYTAAEYDEFLLFKYLIIKNVVNSRIHAETVAAGMTEAAVAFRAISNRLTFMLNDYNEAHVKNNTPKDRQFIIMDSDFNARFDVEVLASAFNMDKADFMGRLVLMDDFSTFDNERFDIIRQESDMLEEVTEEELEIMKALDIKALIVDSEYFQVYDNEAKFTEKYVASGLYWNYFYHTWKTISTSPFANAVLFVGEGESTMTLDDIQTVTFEVDSVSIDNDLNQTISLKFVGANGADGKVVVPGLNYEFVQLDNLVSMGVAVHKYGTFILPPSIVEPGGVARIEVLLWDSENKPVSYYGELIYGRNEPRVGYTIAMTKEDVDE